MPRWEPDAPGRLVKAALALFDERGYEATTVEDIAARAGLTKRTFFRYFSDKREVLFRGSDELRELFVTAVAGAPAHAHPWEAVQAGLAAVAAMFAERHGFACMRDRIIAANPDLQERELIKLDSLAEAIAGALRDHLVADEVATLAAQAGITVFHVTFGLWVAQDDPAAMAPLMAESIERLRTLTAT